MAASVSRELCTVSGTVLRDAGVKLEYIYFFTSGMAGHMAETLKQISNMNTRASCATF